MTATTTRTATRGEPNPPKPGEGHHVAVADLIEAHRHVPGALLPLLHAIQDRLGWVPPDCVPAIAEALARSRAEVHGVISYYHHFRSQPPGRHVLQVCMAEACLACGAKDLAQHAQRLLDCDMHQTRADGAFTLEPVYCLGLCASGPALQLNQALHGRVDAHKLVELLRQATDDESDKPQETAR
ncbi:formate dehydrogenase subunit gamma [Roseateles sp. BYS180W]|uniref:Formate dehydrogenase subunit gamma n=1 Tax=Roseateles rivi TaxID=3299028 RepID=A0ABW7FXV1_9BURK